MKLDYYIKITVGGTENILNVAVKNKVKKLIVTSALMNMIGNVFKKGTGDNIYTEKDFPKPESVDDYYTKSKIL